MIVFILGADGYIGWPLTRSFLARGHEVIAIDSYFRRRAALELDCEPLLPSPTLQKRMTLLKERTGLSGRVYIGDVTDPEFLTGLCRRYEPNVIVHLAEQRAVPYAMMNARKAAFTLKTNLLSTISVIYAVIEGAPTCHIVKLGSLGEYGTPNTPIPEGFCEMTIHGRSDVFLFPRHALDVYHLSKVMDTDLLFLFAKSDGLAVTDLMQGVVYGVDDSGTPPDLRTNFQYDHVFGTVLNRFVAQAICGHPLTVYGGGGQMRGFISLQDAIECIYLAASHPAGRGQLRVYNQFTDTFSVIQLARKVQAVAQGMGNDVRIQRLPNPRREGEDSFYQPEFRGLRELGFQPRLLDERALERMLRFVGAYKTRIDQRKILPDSAEFAARTRDGESPGARDEVVVC
jgi:UDP-sulfoquinovose synthase